MATKKPPRRERDIAEELAALNHNLRELARIFDSKVMSQREQAELVMRAQTLQEREVEALEKIADELDHWPHSRYEK